jgi:hypothetical protein
MYGTVPKPVPGRFIGKKKNLGYLTEARRMLMRVGLEPTPLS